MPPKKPLRKPDPLLQDAQEAPKQKNLPLLRSPSQRIRKRRSSTLQRSPEQPHQPHQAPKKKLSMRGPSMAPGTPQQGPKPRPKLSLTVRGSSMAPGTPSQQLLGGLTKPSIPRSPFVWNGKRLGPKELLPESLINDSLEGHGPVDLPSQPTSSIGSPPKLLQSQISST